MERDPGVPPDLAAWNALVAALARAGRLSDAKSALDSAQLYAQHFNLPPPQEAFGAYIRGWKQARGGGGVGGAASSGDAVTPAVAAFRHFLSLGGTPHAGMCADVVQLCLRGGEPKIARQVIRATELAGVAVDKQRFEPWFERAAAAAAARRASAGGADEGDASPLERFKWFLGLPNKYYGSEWR